MIQASTLKNEEQGGKTKKAKERLGNNKDLKSTRAFFDFDYRITSYMHVSLLSDHRICAVSLY